MRDSFVFYRSFQDAINEASESEQLLIYRSIANYALDRVEPDLTGIAKLAWLLIKPQLEANWKRYEAGVQHGNKGAEYGKLGGRPKKEKPSKNPLHGFGKTLSKPSNVNVNVNKYNAELSFDNVWNLYEKKGNKKTSNNRWDKLSEKKKRLAFENIPSYVKSTPDKQFRKNFETYINQEAWNDELPIKKETNNEQ